MPTAGESIRTQRGERGRDHTSLVSPSPLSAGTGDWLRRTGRAASPVSIREHM